MHAGLTGHRSLDEIRGRSIIEWTADYEKEKNASAVRECFKKGSVRNLEIDYVDADGKITPIEINATVFEMSGDPPGSYFMPRHHRAQAGRRGPAESVSASVKYDEHICYRHRYR